MRISLLLCLGLFTVAASPGLAQLPDDRILTMHVHTDPEDPESPVRLTFNIRLYAQDGGNNEVGWLIGHVEIVRPASGQNPELRWADSAPVVDTVDGLWWIEHDDAQNPTNDEFTLPPLVTGTATATNHSGDDMDFDLEGQVYTPPPGGPPYDITASLTFSVRLAAQPEPPYDGGDEEETEVEE